MHANTKLLLIIIAKCENVSPCVRRPGKKRKLWRKLFARVSRCMHVLNMKACRKPAESYVKPSESYANAMQFRANPIRTPCESIANPSRSYANLRPYANPSVSGEYPGGIREVSRRVSGGWSFSRSPSSPSRSLWPPLRDQSDSPFLPLSGRKGLAAPQVLSER